MQQIMLFGLTERKVRARCRIKELSALSKLRRLDTGPGIYFLCCRGVVVYVGQSHRIPSRIVKHFETKVFDEIRYINVDVNRLNDVEAYWIKRLRPPYNGNRAGSKQRSFAEPAFEIQMQWKTNVATETICTLCARKVLPGQPLRWIKARPIDRNKPIYRIVRVCTHCYSRCGGIADSDLLDRDYHPVFDCSTFTTH